MHNCRLTFTSGEFENVQRMEELLRLDELTKKDMGLSTPSKPSGTNSKTSNRKHKTSVSFVTIISILGR